MARGILELIGLGATLALAAPVGLLGLEWVVAGKPLGAVFLALAVLMVVVEEHLVGPRDLVLDTAGDVVGTVAKEPDEEE